jgi:hypothetical protein
MNRPNFHPAAQVVDFDRWEREMWHDLGHRISPRRTVNRTRHTTVAVVALGLLAFWTGATWQMGSWVAGGAW